MLRKRGEPVRDVRLFLRKHLAPSEIAEHIQGTPHTVFNIPCLMQSGVPIFTVLRLRTAVLF